MDAHLRCIIWGCWPAAGPPPIWSAIADPTLEFLRQLRPRECSLQR